MKILHISGNSLGEKNGGGVSVVLKNLVKYQNEIKDVKSFALSINHNTKKSLSDKYYYFDNIKEQKKFILEFDPDVIIFHGIYFWQYIFLSRFISKNNYIYFIQPHGSFMPFSQKKSKFKKTIANKLFLRSFYLNSYGYIYLNENEKKKSVFSSDNDIIVPNGVEIPKIKKNITIAKDKSIKLFFLGRIHITYKGIDILLEELKKIDNRKQKFSLDFFGYGENKDINFLKNKISYFNNIKISFKGSVFDEEKEKVFKEYDIMVLTSRNEGFPMSILEALSYGNPCIVTPGTNVKEMIDKNHLGWGTEFDSISETIKYAVSDYRNNSNEYIERSTKFIKDNFSWEEIAEISIDKIQEITNHIYYK